MALHRPTPKQLSPEDFSKIAEASAAQTGGNATRVKSYDPNYPVFDVPVNQKVLVYIPNHRVTGPDGSVSLRMDKFSAHPVIDGRTFDNVRCANGITNEALGLDGSCPLCDAMGECWDLYNKKYADICRTKGYQLGSPEEKDNLKDDRKKLIQAMAISKAEVWYTFPIVVIECEEKNGVMTVNPKLDAEGRLSGHPMWYQIRETTYINKWEKGFDSIEGVDDNCPGGLWAVLNFTYDVKNGSQPSKMDSARALVVTFKNVGDKYSQWEQYFDKLTEGWTPQVATQVLALNAIRSKDELVEATDSLMATTRNELSMYALKGAVPQTNTLGNANQTLAQFGGVAPVAPALGAPAGPVAPVAPPSLDSGNIGIDA